MAEEQNGKIKFVPRPSDDDWTSAILENLDDNTALVSVPNCHWTDGGLIKLGLLSKELKKHPIYKLETEGVDFSDFRVLLV